MALTTQEFALYRAFNLLRTLPELKPFREWLKTEQDTVNRDLRLLPESRALFLVQGKGQELDRIEQLIEESPRILEKGREAQAPRI